LFPIGSDHNLSSFSEFNDKFILTDVLKYIGISDEEELHLHITEEKLLNCSEYIYSRPPPSKIQWFRGSQFKQESAVYLLKTLDNSTEAEDLNCVYTASDWRSKLL